MRRGGARGGTAQGNLLPGWAALDLAKVRVGVGVGVEVRVGVGWGWGVEVIAGPRLTLALLEGRLTVILPG